MGRFLRRVEGGKTSTRMEKDDKRTLRLLILITVEAHLCREVGEKEKKP